MSKAIKPEITFEEQIANLQAQMNKIADDETKRTEFFEIKAERNKFIAELNLAK